MLYFLFYLKALLKLNGVDFPLICDTSINIFSLGISWHWLMFCPELALWRQTRLTFTRLAEMAASLLNSYGLRETGLKFWRSNFQADFSDC